MKKRREEKTKGKTLSPSSLLAGAQGWIPFSQILKYTHPFPEGQKSVFFLFSRERRFFVGANGLEPLTVSL